MALVGNVYVPRQNYKVASKSYHLDVNIYLSLSLFFGITFANSGMPEM